MLFKDKLAELRARTGLSQKGLADRAGIPKGTYTNYEQGLRLPSVPVFVRLVRALGVRYEVFEECEDILPREGQAATKKPRKGRGKAKA